MRMNVGATGSKIGRALRLGGMLYSLCPVNHRETSQMWASLSSRMRKRAGGASVRVRYAVLRRAMSRRLKKMWLAGFM